MYRESSCMEMKVNNDSISFDKKTMRLRMTRARNSLSENQREDWSSKAISYLIEVFETMRLTNVLVYIPFRSELDTRSFIEWGWDKGVNILVPRCNPSDYSMEIYSLRHWEELSPGAYGIEEPDPLRLNALDSYFVPEVIILPGLAFDLFGGRLGYGSGYYDRLYERLQPWMDHSKPSILIGLGYEMQVVDKVPMDEHDTPLHMLVTEMGIVDIVRE